MGLAILIRHGRSTANVDDVLAGRMDGVALADDGRAQAAELGAALRDIEFTSLGASPLQRAVETADLAFGGRAYDIVEGVIENAYGDWTGRPLSELRELPEWGPLHSSPSTFVFPGGEAISDIAERAVAAVRERATADGLHAIVSHADIIALVANRAAGAGIDEYHRLAVSPASVTVIRVGDDGSLGLLALNVPASGAAALLHIDKPRDHATV